MMPVGKYVVYDPPAPDMPYLAVLFTHDAAPRVFMFDTYEHATKFLTSNAIENHGKERRPARAPARRRPTQS